VKACIAYVHITIPTLEDTDKQVKLFMLAAQTSLLNNLIGETDSLTKAVLTTIEENFSTETAALNKTGNILISLLGFMVAVPSNPED